MNVRNPYFRDTNWECSPVAPLRHSLHSLSAELLADVGLVECDRDVVLDEAGPVGKKIPLGSEVALRQPARHPLLDSFPGGSAFSRRFLRLVRIDGLRVRVLRKMRQQCRALGQNRREEHLAGLLLVFASRPKHIGQKLFLRAFERAA